MVNVRSLVKTICSVAFIVIASNYWLSRAGARNLSTIIGIPYLKDGDTLVIDGRELRLDGIEACEYDQIAQAADGPWHCGTAAKRHLA
ncbi:unnamed protein product, partial [Ectocarpus fasciculatus]